MPPAAVVHFNHPTRESCACSRRRPLAYFKWTSDPKDVTCDACRRTFAYKEAAR